MSETEFPCTTDFCNLPFVAKLDQERTTGDGFQEFNFSCSFTSMYEMFLYSLRKISYNIAHHRCADLGFTCLRTGNHSEAGWIKTPTLLYETADTY